MGLKMKKTEDFEEDLISRQVWVWIGACIDVDLHDEGEIENALVDEDLDLLVSYATEDQEVNQKAYLIREDLKRDNKALLDLLENNPDIVFSRCKVQIKDYESKKTIFSQFD